MLPLDDFWNPSKLRSKDGGTVTNVLHGLQQLLTALGHERALSKNSRSVLEALFRYRNSSLHLGYDWPKERRIEFAAAIATEEWDKWFFVNHDPTNDPGKHPCLICMRDEFAQAALDEIPTIAGALRNVCISLSDARSPSK